MSRPRLPSLEEPQGRGWLVERVVGLTLLGLALLCTGGGAVLATLELEETVACSGVLEPLEVSRAHSLATGLLSSVEVEAGSRVEAGQTLAHLDGFDLRAELRRLRLQSRHQLSNRTASRWDRELLQQRMAELEQRLSRLQVVAPAGGVVLTEGARDRLGARILEGELLFEIGSAGSWKAVLGVPEGRIDGIRLGDPVQLAVPAVADLGGWLGERLAGEVMFVGAQADELGAYRVEVTVDSGSAALEKAAALRRGMSVQARIVTRSAPAMELISRYLERRVRGGA